MSHPYRDLPDHCFWSKAMSAPAPGRIDPVTRSGRIGATDKVSTMGSCFAQHIGKRVQKLGLHYFVPEAAPDHLDEAARAAGNYGIFSARYGNVYTVRQAVQLFDRAFGALEPVEDVWAHPEGGYVDAFRPQIDREPLASPEAVRAAQAAHLAAVRAVFLESDWLVFTLGLTEGWRSKRDGCVYPLAPGVAGGSFDPARHEFVNFGLDEVRQDLFAFIERVRGRNPSVKILLTVSPVALAATYEPRHVLESTVYSKAVLRVAADEARARYDDVFYFPSFEIITSPASCGRYYADDLRQVTKLGVDHVMRVFEDHFVSPSQEREAPVDLGATIFESDDVVCDEEAIERAMQRSNVQRA